MRTNNGEALHAGTDDPTAVVDELRAGSRSDAGLTRYAFRQRVGDRVSSQFGQRVRVTSDAEFVEDLLAIGFLVGDDEDLADGEDR